MLVAQYMQWVKKVDKNLYEIRLKCPNSIQRALYFHVINNRLLHMDLLRKRRKHLKEK